MKKSSKLTAVFAASALAMTMSATWAQDHVTTTSAPLPINAVPISAPILPEILPSSIQMRGIVHQVVTDGEASWIHVKENVNQDPSAGVILRVSSETWIVDSASGLPMNLADIKADDQIIAYHSPIMTRSLPPQTAAKVLLVNPPEDKGAGTYVKVAKLTRKEDGSLKLLNDNGDLVLTILPETPISPFETKNIVTIDDIQEGSEMIAYFDFMALSYPAQAGADRVVLFPRGEQLTPVDAVTTETSGVSVSEDLSKLIINDHEVALATNEALFTTANGMVMVPVRAAATALGFDVTWSDAAQSVELRRGGQTAALQIGSESVRVGELTLSMTHKPVLTNGKTYVPMSLFNQLVRPLK